MLGFVFRSLAFLAAAKFVAHCAPTKCTTALLGGDLAKLGWLLDLDGTLYNPSGLLTGTDKLFKKLFKTLDDDKDDLPFALLSNSIMKKDDVIRKLSIGKFAVPGDYGKKLVKDKHVHTAGISVANFMATEAPNNAKIYTIGTDFDAGGTIGKYNLKTLLGEASPEKDKTWTVRSDLSLDDIYSWANSSLGGDPVYVMGAFHLGDPTNTLIPDPVTGKAGYTTLDYELSKKINILLRNKATFVVGASDLVDTQPKIPNMVDVDPSRPTIGGFEQLQLASAEMGPGTEAGKRHFNTGKGGKKGTDFMMGEALRLLKTQKIDLTAENVVMVGDNLGTDIRAGSMAKMKTILVLSGAHKVADIASWEHEPTCWLNNVGELADML